MNKLPDKELLRVDEVAAYFSVTESTIRRWIDHDILMAKKMVGVVRIPRDSVINCRFFEKYGEKTVA
jgi:excisionase family DNA binding protein